MENFNNEVTEKIEEKCNEMMQSSPRDVVGGEEEFKFEYKGKTYDVWIRAFWEKADWYDATVKGNGIDLKLTDEF